MGLGMGGGGVARMKALGDRNCLAFQGEGSSVHPQAPGKGAGGLKGRGGRAIVWCWLCLEKGADRGVGPLCAALSSAFQLRSRRPRRPWGKGWGDWAWRVVRMLRDSVGGKRCGDAGGSRG